jgi:hypothetical protein
MIHRKYSHTVQDEVTNTIYHKGNYSDCREWIAKQPDWEQYGIVSQDTGRFVSFVISR